jgi:hypothetical protein
MSGFNTKQHRTRTHLILKDPQTILPEKICHQPGVSLMLKFVPLGCKHGVDDDVGPCGLRGSVRFTLRYSPHNTTPTASHCLQPLKASRSAAHRRV